MRPSALSGLLICWCRRGQWRGRGTDRHYHPFFPVGEGEAPSPVGSVARISEAHPGSSWAGPWRAPDAAFGLIRATHLLVSTRSVARARGPTVTTIPLIRWERGGTQPRRPRSPDKRSASGIPAGWAVARPGCGLRPYPGYASADVDAVGGVPSRRGEGRALKPGR